MPLTSVASDPEALTITVVGEYAVPVERLFAAYLDPRQLERFWGPVEWPATFSRHDAAPGGRSEYFMTGPDGERSAGYWKWLAVDAPRSFEVEDGFANEDGTDNTELPAMRMVFTFEPLPEGSRFTSVTHFGSLEALQTVVDMGMEEGLRSAMSQMDAVLADLESFAAGRAVEAQLLSDTKVRVSRVIRGTVEQVWRAHHDADLMRRWLLGPDGWTMPVCEVAENVGDTYRYEWAPTVGGPADGAPPFGFTGELLESASPYREVTTENMIGMEGPGTTNELTLTPVEGGTLLSLVITYPSQELRDIVLGTGMTDGMETSYARLESELVGA
ncbi:SRPBCC family protein [Demequina gelatinilytica]|uniref:SRPBCC family protein n=1 Tax=Demequina gelatinilytica TaxID=1638980 RepID=UPI00078442E1|nr:SRPBCC family protein [Demequina gelatinilytica]